MSSIDERIVQMQFNNSQFEKGIKESLKSLDALKEGLDLEGSAKQLKALQKAGDSFSLAKMAEGIESVSKRFSTLGIVGMRVIDNLANSAYYNGKRLISSLSIDQVTAGWTKYGQKTASVQTIMNATGKSIDEVNGYLDKLMWFSDETSYGFTDMTQALGQLTSAGGDIERLIPMIEGIANATAFAGKGTGEFSRAMYNLNQSYSAGYLQYMDWKSLELAGIASKQLKEQLIEAGKATGKLNKDGKTAKGTLVTVSNLGQTLNEKWANTEVMEKAFGKFAEMTEKAYELVQEGKFDTASDAYAYLATQYDDISITAAKAAQEAKTFTEALDATKDAVSSSWMKTFELIFGNYDQAKVMWTDLANYLWDIFASGGEARNEMLQEWQELGGRDSLLAGVYDMFEALKNVIDAVKAAIAQVIPPMTAEKLVEISNAVKDFGASLKTLTEIRTEIIKKPSEADDEIDILGGFIPGQTKKVKADLEELERTINRGMRGDDVKKLQERLKQLGYDIGETGVDGIYGPKTQAALKKFQEDYGLAIDGIYGKLSHAKMSEALGIGDETESKKIRVAGKEITIYSDTLKKIRSIVKGVASVFSIFGQVLNFAFNVVKIGLDVLSPLADMLFTIAAALGDWLTELNDAIRESGFFEKAINVIKTALAPVKKFLEGIKDAVLTFLGIGEKVDGLGNSVETLASVWARLKESVKGSIVWSAIGNAWDSLKDSAEKLYVALKNLWNKLKELSGGAFDKVKEKLTSLFSPKDEGNDGGSNWISKVITAIANSISKGIDLLTSAVDKIPGIVENIKAFFSTIKNYIIDPSSLSEDRASGAISWYADAVMQVYEKLDSLFGKAGKLRPIIEKVKTIFSDLWDSLKSFFGISNDEKGLANANQSQSNGNGSQGDSGTLDRLQKEESFLDKFSAIWDTVSSTISKLWNSISSFVNQNGGFGSIIMLIETLFALKMLKKFGGFLGSTVEFGEKVLELGKGLTDAVGGVAKAIPEVIKSAASFITDLGQSAKDAVKAYKRSQTLKYLGGVLLSLAAVIAVIVAGVYILGSMDENALIRGGIAMAGIMTAIAILIAVLLSFQRNSKVRKIANGDSTTPDAFNNLGKTLLLISASMLIMVRAIQKLGGMSWEELEKGFIGLAGLMVAIIAFTKVVSGMDKGSVSIKGLIGMAVSVWMLVKILKSLSKMDTLEYANGLLKLMGVMLVLKIFTSSITKSGGNVQIKGMLSLAASVWILIKIMKMIANMPAGEYAAGLLGLIGVLTVFGVFMKIFLKTTNKFDKDGKQIQQSLKVGGMLSIAAAVWVLVKVMKMIASMTPGDYIGGLLGLIGVMTVFGLFVAAMNRLGSTVRKGDKSWKSLAKMGGLLAAALSIAILAGVVYALGHMNTKTLLKGVLALAGICAGLGLLVKQIRDIDIKGGIGMLIGMLGLIAVMIAFSSALNATKDIDSKKMLSFGLALGGMLTGLGIFVKMAGSLGVGGILSVAGTILAIAGALGVVIAAVAAINKIPGVKDFMMSGVEAIGEAVGRLIGAMEGAKLTTFSGSLATFEKNIESIDIDQDKVDNALAAATAVRDFASSLNEVTINEALYVAFSGGKTPFINFCKGMVEFSTAIGEFDTNLPNYSKEQYKELQTRAESAVAVAEVIRDFANGLPEITIADAVLSWVTGGEGSLGQFARDMNTFATSIGDFNTNLPTTEEISYEELKTRAESAVNVANVIQKFVNGLPEITIADAVFSLLTGGESSFSQFAKDLGTFGTGIQDFNTNLPKMDDLDYDELTKRTDSAVKVATIVQGFVNGLPEITLSDVLLNWVTGGESSFSRFASDMTVFGESIGKFNSNLPSSDMVDYEDLSSRTTKATSVAQAVADFASGIPSLTISDALNMWIGSGKSTFSQFASDMANFGTGMRDYADAIVDVPDVEMDTDTAMKSATKVADFFKLISSDEYNLEANNGAWSKFWFGDNKTESFIENLEGFGDNLNTFSEKVNSFSQGTTKDDLDVAIDALKKIAEVGMVTADMRFDPGVLSSITTSLPLFRRAFEDLKEEFYEEKIDMSFVTSFSNAVGQIGNAVSAFASTDTESFKTKMDALKGIFSTNEDATSATNSIFSNVSIDTKPITDACDKAIMAIRAYRSKFVTAGQYMASGLAQGIKISASSARIAAENMARSALSGAQSILQIASPSKRTEEFGMYFSQGMAKGITAYSSAVTSASSDVSQQALNSVRASISSMSGLLDENVSSDPVIRPIVDLTNVGEGARAIRSMLSGGSTISVGSNVDNVREASASISRASANQNGSASGNIDNSSVNSNAVNLSGNNFYIRSEQDIRSLASEIASLSYQQKRGLGGHA